MPDFQEIKIDGLAQLEQNLLRLPEPMARKVVLLAVRSGGRVILKAAQQRAPVKKTRGGYHKEKRGLGRKGIIARFRVRGLGVRGAEIHGTLGLRIRPREQSAFYLRFLEFGTSAHLIRPRKRGGVIFVPGRGFMKSVEHPGLTRRPFFGPGFLASREQAVAKIIEVARARTEAVVKQAVRV